LNGDLLDLGDSFRDVNKRLGNSGLGLDNLSLDRGIVNNFFNSFNRDIFNFSFISRLRNVFGLVFNLIIVSVGLLDGDIFGSLDSFVVNVGSFVGDLFNIGFSFDGLSHGLLLGNSNLRLDEGLVNLGLDVGNLGLDVGNLGLDVL